MFVLVAKDTRKKWNNTIRNKKNSRKIKNVLLIANVGLTALVIIANAEIIARVDHHALQKLIKNAVQTAYADQIANVGITVIVDLHRKNKRMWLFVNVDHNVHVRIANASLLNPIKSNINAMKGQSRKLI